MYNYGIGYVVFLRSLASMHRKPHLPSKLCQTCQRPFTWRKKWQDCWDDVRHCSQRCRRNARQLAREARDDVH
ncbi:DUF2256 domain-containing protein [Cobetia amphilecti]|uniref:DUF2256 domain-containing protein n=1 Tax=Cobetia amphilecti TaxID=1055104 RepID=UPI0031592FBD